MTYDIGQNSKVLIISRGKLGAGSISVDLSKILDAESRLSEISFLQSAVVAAELMTIFNDAANDCGKSLSVIAYEILSAENTIQQIKSDIILDELPAALERLGLKKSNEDIRNALIVRNHKYQQMSEILNHLSSVQFLLNEKIKCFVRAYNTCRLVADQKSRSPGAAYNLSTFVGSTSQPGEDEPMVAVGHSRPTLRGDNHE